MILTEIVGTRKGESLMNSQWTFYSVYSNTIHSNHSTVHQTSNPKSTCVVPCMRLTQWRKLQSTGVSTTTKDRG